MLLVGSVCDWKGRGVRLGRPLPRPVVVRAVEEGGGGGRAEGVCGGWIGVVAVVLLSQGLSGCGGGDLTWSTTDIGALKLSLRTRDGEVTRLRAFGDSSEVSWSCERVKQVRKWHFIIPKCC